MNLDALEAASLFLGAGLFFSLLWTSSALGMGWRRHRVRADGNCLFRALAFPLYHHTEVRRSLSNHVRTHWDRYRHFVPAVEHRLWYDRSITDGVWGDELTLQSFAEVYRYHIRVLDSDTFRLISEYGSQHGRKKMLLYDGEHYDLLTKSIV